MLVLGWVKLGELTRSLHASVNHYITTFVNGYKSKVPAIHGLSDPLVLLFFTVEWIAFLLQEVKIIFISPIFMSYTSCSLRGITHFNHPVAIA